MRTLKTFRSLCFISFLLASHCNSASSIDTSNQHHGKGIKQLLINSIGEKGILNSVNLTLNEDFTNETIIKKRRPILNKITVKARPILQYVVNEGKGAIQEFLTLLQAEVNKGAEDEKSNDEAISVVFDLVNAKDYQGKTLLHWAASRGDKEIVKYLIIKGADPLMQDQYGDLPLHIFLRDHKPYLLDGKRRETLKYFIRDSNYNYKNGNKRKQYPLHYAIKNKDLFSVQFLTQYEDIVITNALRREAIQSKQLDIVEAVLKKDTVKKHINKKSAALFFFAIREGTPKMVQYFIKNGANIKIQNEGETPLRMAIAQKNLKMVQVFVTNTNDANAQDKQGRTPLHWAVLEGNFSIVKYLIKKKSNLTAQDANGQKPINLVEQHKNSKDKSEIKRYLESLQK